MNCVNKEGGIFCLRIPPGAMKSILSHLHPSKAIPSLSPEVATTRESIASLDPFEWYAADVEQETVADHRLSWSIQGFFFNAVHYLATATATIESWAKIDHISFRNALRIVKPGMYCFFARMFGHCKLKMRRFLREDSDHIACPSPAHVLTLAHGLSVDRIWLTPRLTATTVPDSSLSSPWRTNSVLPLSEISPVIRSTSSCEMEISVNMSDPAGRTNLIVSSYIRG